MYRIQVQKCRTNIPYSMFTSEICCSIYMHSTVFGGLTMVMYMLETQNEIMKKYGQVSETRD